MCWSDVLEPWGRDGATGGDLSSSGSGKLKSLDSPCADRRNDEFGLLTYRSKLRRRARYLQKEVGTKSTRLVADTLLAGIIAELGRGKPFSYSGV
jgi:hypothetical protein